MSMGKKSVKQVVFGFLLGAGLNVVVFNAGLLLSSAPSNAFQVIRFILMSFIGLVQLIYQLPVILVLRWRGYRDLALGVMLATSAYLLLNVAYWGLLTSGRNDL